MSAKTSSPKKSSPKKSSPKNKSPKKSQSKKKSPKKSPPAKLLSGKGVTASKLIAAKPKIVASKHQEYEPDIIVIGREGRISDTSKRSTYRKSNIEDDTPVKPKPNTKMTQMLTSSIYHDKEINEITKSEIIDEVINADIQYFLAFCCLLYLVRSLYVACYVIIAIERYKLSYDNYFDLGLFLLNLFFAIFMFLTASTGYLFCWKIKLHYAKPFLFCLSVTTIMVAAKLIILIIWFETGKIIVFLRLKEQ